MSKHINKEFLENNGFENIGSSEAIPNYSNNSGDWNVNCRFGYTNGMMNEFGCIHIDCWKGDGTGTSIIKRASVHGCICTEDDLKNILVLCDIPIKLKFSPNNEQ